MSEAQVFTPDKISKRILYLINEVRSEYNLKKLELDKQLSFLAGEHACNMSTKRVAFSHDGFDDRYKNSPAALTFSENIGTLEPGSEDPAQDLLYAWLSEPLSFSRILSSFTHTGIGVAESEDGGWYVTQIFATLHSKMSRKDLLIAVGRAANAVRVASGLPSLTLSMTATAKLYKFCEENREAILSLTISAAKMMFNHCHEAEFITETLRNEDDVLAQFIKQVRERSTFRWLLRKDDYDAMAFVMKRVNRESTVCTILVGRHQMRYNKVPVLHMHYPNAYKCLQMLNDYRKAHELEPMFLSHQFCRVADAHCKSMKDGAEIEVRNFRGKVVKYLPGGTIRAGVCLVPASPDPIPEIFLMWISNEQSRSELLLNDPLFGFGMAIGNNDMCYVTRITGTKGANDAVDTREIVISEPDTPLYLPLTDDEDE